eukprot:scaffold613_cov243-Pinguiococcus_pyrenoidosus.AAC.49
MNSSLRRHTVTPKTDWLSHCLRRQCAALCAARSASAVPRSWSWICSSWNSDSSFRKAFRTTFSASGLPWRGMTCTSAFTIAGAALPRTGRK